MVSSSAVVGVVGPWAYNEAFQGMVAQQLSLLQSRVTVESVTLVPLTQQASRRLSQLDATYKVGFTVLCYGDESRLAASIPASLASPQFLTAFQLATAGSVISVSAGDAPSISGACPAALCDTTVGERYRIVSGACRCQAMSDGETKGAVFGGVVIILVFVLPMAVLLRQLTRGTQLVGEPAAAADRPYRKISLA
jgi:hypothetical protein